MRKIALLLLIFSVVLLGLSARVQAQDGGVLARVIARGKLVCGYNGKLPGFGYIDPNTKKISGFDVDFCRVIAAAILGNADAVDFQLVAPADRFIVMQENKIDIFIENTTFTFDRDTEQGADFGPTTFYDGQTVMTRVADKLTKLEDLKGATICSIKGTTTEQNITDAMAAIDKPFKLVTFDDESQVADAFYNNQCDALTSDRSQLVSDRALHRNPSAYILFDKNLSKEPLTPFYKEGDAQWGNVVRWSVYATIIAEEQGITSQNVDEMVTNAKNPEARRLLGVEGDLYKQIGFDKNWAYNIIKQVGNYGEIYDRNLGPQTPFNLPRGLNDLWTKGGLIYAPPYR
ncbi:MAG TPA: amino acid ABC transporter substrate-binding protein [Aggregatilineales bacterium]|nr:amino acid ABC transporter substrate-binding protein [Aggregatilineales bacterium]